MSVTYIEDNQPPLFDFVPASTLLLYYMSQGGPYSGSHSQA